MNRLVLLSILLSACTRDQNFGTVVGNPGSGVMRVASGEGITTRSATVAVGELRWTDCDQGGIDLPVGQTIDLLGDQALEFPDGTWCEVQVQFDGPLLLEGTTSIDGARVPVALEVDLDVAVIAAGEGFRVGRTAQVLELAGPGWFGLADLSAPEPPDTTFRIEPGDAAHDTLAAAVALTSAIYDDPDGDGEISTPEREAGAAATGSRRPVR